MHALLIVSALALADASGQHHDHSEKLGKVIQVANINLE